MRKTLTLICGIILSSTMAMAQSMDHSTMDLQLMENAEMMGDIEVGAPV